MVCSVASLSVYLNPVYSDLQALVGPITLIGKGAVRFFPDVALPDDAPFAFPESPLRNSKKGMPDFRPLQTESVMTAPGRSQPQSSLDDIV